MKNLKNLGKALTKAEQKTINGARQPKELCGPFPNTVHCVQPTTCQSTPPDENGQVTWFCA